MVELVSVALNYDIHLRYPYLFPVDRFYEY